jgi:glucose-1-phosphate thymidylyltransferase
MTSRAVVLARGLGRRMREEDQGAPLTDAQQQAAAAGQKAMMPIGGRLFLDYSLNAIADAGLQRVALVVAPDHDAIRRYYTVERPPRRLALDFVVQQEPIGTADAVLAVERWTAGYSFLVMNGDNIYPAPMLRELAALNEPGLPVFRRDELVRSGNIPDERVAAFALLEIRDGYLTDIVEKPSAEQFAAAPSSAPVSLNCWHFDRGIFDACRRVEKSPRGEFELPNAVRLAVREGMRFRAIPAVGPLLDLSRRADAADVGRRLAGLTPQP